MKYLPNKFQWGVLLGNIFDHYDTALYALLAPFFSHQFFPSTDPLTSLILTYSLLPLSIFTRPAGTLFFGMIGDLLCGKTAFTLSLLGVTITTTLMTFIPTYDQVGYWAPLLLTVTRLFQSFFAAGEVSSGGVLLMENTPSEQKNFMSGLYNTSTMGGILLASVAVMVLGMMEATENGWRVLYLIGSLTIIFVYLLRKDSTYRKHTKPSSGIKDLCINLWNYKASILTIALVYGFSYACFSAAFTLVNAILPYVSLLSKVDAMKTNTLLMVIDFLLLPFFAWIGCFVTHRNMLLAGAAATIVFGIPLYAALEGAGMERALFVRFFLMLIGVSFSATVLPWSQKLLPESVRFTGTGVAFSLGFQLVGVPTTAISLWLYQQTKMSSSAAWYWVFLATVSFVLVVWVSFKQKVTAAEI